MNAEQVYVYHQRGNNLAAVVGLDKSTPYDKAKDVAMREAAYQKTADKDLTVTEFKRCALN